MKKCLTTLLLLLATTACADYLELINNTSFQLTAVVQDARGVSIGQVPISPGTTTNWASWDQSSSYSQSPYTVSWMCPAGDTYSSCDGVPEGATVSAASCDGTHTCQPPPQNAQTPDTQGTVDSAY